MQRRKVIATAGAVTATATAAVIALSANFGIFGLTNENSNVGKFPAVDGSNEPTVTSPSGGPPAQDDHHGDEPPNGDHHGHDEDD